MNGCSFVAQFAIRARRKSFSYSLLFFLISVAMAAISACSSDDTSPSAIGTSDQASPTGDGLATISNPNEGASPGAEEFFIGSNQFRSVKVTLEEGDVLTVVYEVRVRSIGDVALRDGTEGSDVRENPQYTEFQVGILDPLENEVVLVDQESKMAADTIEITAEASGEYTIVFFNPLRLQTQTVKVEYTVTQ